MVIIITTSLSRGGGRGGIATSRPVVHPTAEVLGEELGKLGVRDDLLAATIIRWSRRVVVVETAQELHGAAGVVFNRQGQQPRELGVKVWRGEVRKCHRAIGAGFVAAEKVFEGGRPCIALGQRPALETKDLLHGCVVAGVDNSSRMGKLCVCEREESASQPQHCVC